jgi:hypothetical protein
VSILPLQINCKAENFKCEKCKYQGTTLTNMNQFQDKNIKEQVPVIIHFSNCNHSVFQNAGVCE